MDPDLIIRVDSSFTFWGKLPPSGFGFVVGPEGLDGITDGVATKGETVARPDEHGDFDLSTFLDSRIVSLSGTCLAESPQQLKWWGESFTGLLVGRRGTITMDHLGDIRWGRASLAPGTQKKFKVHSTDSLSADFQVQLKFSNPRFYGVSRTTASGEAARNYGNFPASPVHVITGAGSGYTISGGGKSFAVTQAVTSGNPHTLDTASGLLTIGGVPVFGKINGAFIPVPNGGSVIYTIAPTSGSMSMATTTPDTYV